MAYAKAKPMKAMMEKLRPNDRVSFLYVGGTKPEDADRWMFFVSGIRAWEADMETFGLCTLTFSVPALYAEEHPTAFQALFVNFAKAVNAIHGHAGFAFTLSQPREDANEGTEAFKASHMNGIDVGNPVIIGHRVKCGIRDHIKTVGWVTAVNYKLLEKVGGIGVLRSELSVNWFAKYDYGNGVVIQAGPKPEAASVEVNPRPAIYVLPNMALKDIRVAEILSIHSGSQHGEPRLYGLVAEKWLTRFDVPEDKLQAYKTKLLSEPKLTKDTMLRNPLWMSGE